MLPTKNKQVDKSLQDIPDPVSDSSVSPYQPQDSTQDPEFTSTSPSTEGANKESSKRRSVACKTCHSLKVKCVPSDPTNPLGQCVRCKRANRQCEFDRTQIRKRKPVNKPSSNSPIIKRQSSPNDLKLKTLESQIYELQQKLQNRESVIDQQNQTIEIQRNAITSVTSLNKSQPSLSPTDSNVSNSRQAPTPLNGINSPRTHLQGYQTPSAPPPNQQLSQLKYVEREMKFLEEISLDQSMNVTTEVMSASERRIQLYRDRFDYSNNDMISRGIVTEAQCERMLNLFITKIHNRYPLIGLPTDLSLNSMRKNEPYILLMMVYISTVLDSDISDTSNDVQLQLENMVAESLAGEVLVVGNKTVELLKSMLLYCMWYIPPEMFHHRRYQLFSLLCVSMVHDLGLTGRPYFFYNKAEGSVKKAAFSEDPQGLEAQSLIMMVYLVSVSTSLFLRRRIPVQWTDYCETCCTELENNGKRNYSLIALYARLNNILERIHYMIHSPTENITLYELSSSRYKYAVCEIQRRLNTLKSRIQVISKNDPEDYHSLMSYYFSVQAFLYEPALHNVFGNEAVPNINETSEIPPFLAESIEMSLESCVLTLKHFLNLSIEVIAIDPLFHSARVTYTAGMLLRLRYLSITVPSFAPYRYMSDETMTVMKNLTARIYQASIKHRKNHFLSKMRLVLSLFTQTFLSQCKSTYRSMVEEGYNGPNNYPANATSRLSQGSQQLLPSSLYPFAAQETSRTRLDQLLPQVTSTRPPINSPASAQPAASTKSSPNPLPFPVASLDNQQHDPTIPMASLPQFGRQFSEPPPLLTTNPNNLPSPSALLHPQNSQFPTAMQGLAPPPPPTGPRTSSPRFPSFVDSIDPPNGSSSASQPQQLPRRQSAFTLPCNPLYGTTKTTNDDIPLNPGEHSENLECHYWALNDEFWSDLLLGSDHNGQVIDHALNTFYMSDYQSKM